MYGENKIDISELKKLCLADLTQISKLTEEDLSVLINELIENQDTEAEQQLLELCFVQLEQLDNYKDDIDNDKILCALKTASIEEKPKSDVIVCHKKKKISIKHLLVAAAIIAIGTTSILSSTVLGEDANIQMFSDERRMYVSRAKPGINEKGLLKETCLNIETLKAMYPEIMLPQHIPENYHFDSAEICDSSESLNISVTYANSNDENLISIDMYKENPDTASSKLTIECDEDSIRTFTHDGITYTFAANYDINVVTWTQSEDTVYTLFMPNSVDMEEVLYSFK